MSEVKTKSGVINRGFCERCHTIAPVHHEEIDGQMYLVKDCPNCGEVKTRISSDAKRYKEKRELCNFDAEKQGTCSLKCIGCNHGFKPKLVHIDVTNRCNLNCPMCLANIQGMGFEFNPPIGYFEKIFKALAEYDPKPKVQFFGGEPTARDDLLDIIKLAKQYKLPVRVVTNGIKLADKDYCDALLDTRAYLLFGFDGRNPEIYKRMCNSAKVLDLKLRAFDNIRKHGVPEHSDAFSARRMTILCTLGLGVNDEYMGDFIEFCHERREQIGIVALIPLQVTPGPKQIAPESTTIEDVEKIMAKELPGSEFVPVAKLQSLKTMEETFKFRISLGGSHPNCESVTLLFADDERYHPAEHYLKRSFGEVVEELAAYDKKMGKKLDRTLFARLFGQTGRKIRLGLGIARLVLKNVRLGRVIGKNPVRNLFTMVWQKIRYGKQWKKLLRRYTGVKGILRLIVLPYEDEGWLESSRLKTCPVAFAYENPEDEKIELMPFCTYFVYKNEVLRKTTERWGTTDGPAKTAACEGCGASCEAEVG